jgi:hypothetical protein
MSGTSIGPSLKPGFWFSIKRSKKALILLSLFLFLAVASFFVKFSLTGRFEGVFLLKGKNGALYEIKDDLYLGDGSRVILSLDFERLVYHLPRLFKHKDPSKAYLDFDWDSRNGRGFVKNMMPGGRQLITFFGRYKDESDNYVSGLFVGGGLPENVVGDDEIKMSQTGMAYYDGKRWYHIWCTVNEAIVSADTGYMAYPGKWAFEGSRILNESSKRLALMSSHKVVLDGVPLHVERYAYFRAGKTYFTLSVRIRNIGDKTVNYNYVYGDEPWLGNFGSSEGNIGWLKDRTIIYTQTIDPRKYDYAGFYDYGNSLVSKGHDFTKVANFIQWIENRPKYVYYANSPIIYEIAGIKDNSDMFVPLGSNTRFIGLEWKTMHLAPGESDHFSIAVGMAGHDARTDLPVKPEVRRGNP